MLALAGWLGLFGNDMRRWSLGLRGFTLLEVVSARDETEALGQLLQRRPDLAGRFLPARNSAMKVAVVDYGSGNLASASRALMLAAERSGLDAEVEVTADPDTVARADRVVLPGQGAFADCARGLPRCPACARRSKPSTARGTPFLGICVGMQLMAERGLEHDVTAGFGWIPGDIAEMPAPGLRLPQMGWNALDFAPGAHRCWTGCCPATMPISCTATRWWAAIRAR